MPYKYKDIERKLRKLGYDIKRQGKGSHVIFSNGTSMIPVPKHGGKDISPLVERSIIQILGIDRETFHNL